jgi:hypothetical protein
LRGGRLQQLVVEPDGGGLVQRAQPLAGGVLGGFLGRLGAGVVFQWDARALGQQLQRLTEVERLLLLDEGNQVAALATAEAVPVLFIGENVKRWGALAMEGAEALIGLARLPERNNRSDFFDNIELLLDPLDNARRFRGRVPRG